MPAGYRCGAETPEETMETKSGTGRGGGAFKGLTAHRLVCTSSFRDRGLLHHLVKVVSGVISQRIKGRRTNVEHADP